jgi:hypothetical protein
MEGLIKVEKMFHERFYGNMVFILTWLRRNICMLLDETRIWKGVRG